MKAELTELAAAALGDDPRTALRAVAQLRLVSERRAALLVRRARNQGMSWAEMAAELGVTKQAVHRKYGGRGAFGLRNEP